MKSTLTEPSIHDELAEFYSLWRDAYLGKKNSEADEIKLLADMLSGPPRAKTVIDLGGGIGLHAIALAKLGFEVTLLDQATTALSIAKRANPQLKTIEANFSAIALEGNFDACLSMLSSANFLLDEIEQRAFYNWISGHINNLAIFDQINISRLPKEHSDSCQAEDKHFRVNVLRDWHFEADKLHTSFAYEFVDKASEATKIINEHHVQKFLSVDQLMAFMGRDWRVVALLGDCDLNQVFDQQSSPRMITVFKKQ